MRILPLILLVVLAGCSPDSPSSKTSVAFLVTHPKRLQTLRDQCHKDRAQVGDTVCARVAEATNRRFFGNSKTPYTPPKSSPKF